LNQLNELLLKGAQHGVLTEVLFGKQSRPPPGVEATLRISDQGTQGRREGGCIARGHAGAGLLGEHGKFAAGRGAGHQRAATGQDA
jgi:hypothetical protein